MGGGTPREQVLDMFRPLSLAHSFGLPAICTSVHYCVNILGRLLATSVQNPRLL